MAAKFDARNHSGSAAACACLPISSAADTATIAAVSVCLAPVRIRLSNL